MTAALLARRVAAAVLGQAAAGQASGADLLQHHQQAAARCVRALATAAWREQPVLRRGTSAWPRQQLPAWRQQPAGSRHAAGGSGTSCWGSCWARRAYQTAADRERERRRKGITDGGLYLGAVVLGMIGFSYASVPLYRAFCQATGYGGAVGKAHNIEAKLKAREEQPNPELEAKAKQREIRVWFTADVADDMPWAFKPTQEFIAVRPGESALAFFTAHNKSARPITGVSTYNVVPDKAALYFNKIQCFCFEEQRLRGGEVVDMPVFFYIDPELADDFNCRNIHDITLSYTFYRVEDDEDEEQQQQQQQAGVRLHGAVELPPGIAPPAGGAWTSGVVVAPSGAEAAAVSKPAAPAGAAGAPAAGGG